MTNPPFYRNLLPATPTRPATVGDDVIAVKRAMWRAGFFPWNEFNNVYNTAIADAVKVFEQAYKFAVPDRAYTRQTHEKLASLKMVNGEPVFDEKATDLYNDERVANSTPTLAEIKQFITEVGFQLYLYRDSISYTQRRPIYPIVRQIENPRYAKHLDCSGTAIYIPWLADRHFRARGITVPSPDPTYGYSGYGNTWSLARGGVSVAESEAEIGDLAFYSSSISHVATVIALNPTRVLSNGSQGGPYFLPLRYRRDFRYLRRYPLRREV